MQVNPTKDEVPMDEDLPEDDAMSEPLPDDSSDSDIAECSAPVAHGRCTNPLAS